MIPVFKEILNFAKNGDFEKLKAVIEEDDLIDDINDVKGHDEITPLHEAAQYGHNDIVEYLLEDGMEPDVRCLSTGMTPLYFATRFDRVDNVKTLLEWDANPNIANKMMGSSPLHVAVKKANKEIVALLMRFGANENLKNDFGKTPLSICKDDVIKEVIENKGMDVKEEMNRALMKIEDYERRFLEKDATIHDLKEQIGKLKKGNHTLKARIRHMKGVFKKRVGIEVGKKLKRFQGDMVNLVKEHLVFVQNDQPKPTEKGREKEKEKK